MDFFGAQARARHQSRVLTLAFAACMIGVVLVLNVVVLTALRIARATGRDAEPFQDSLSHWAALHPGAVLVTTLATAGFIAAASLTRMYQLREGGGYVARSLGGVRVERSTPDPRRRQLHNVVEEMALASGVPVPEVYVLEREDGINAFAAGHTPANAAIAVTRGALQHLSRDQLQGVIAHEFSHILNGDMRLSMRLIGLVFGLMAVSLAGRLLIRVASNGRRQAWPVMMLGLGVAAIGQTGFWAGRMLQAWISRTRECLADASAIQFTRHPDGLRDALIRAAAQGSNRRFASPVMDEVAHMLFVPALNRFLATHPSLLERVSALDPQVNKDRLEAMVRMAGEQLRTEATADAADLTGVPPQRSPGVPITGSPVPAAAALIAASAGEPDRHHLDRAIAVRQALPPELRASAENPAHAQALLLGIVIHAAKPAIREQQLAFVGQRFGAAMQRAVQEPAAILARLSPLLRLPAVLQLIPALRGLSDADRLHFTSTLAELSRLDGQLSVFEYSLEKLARRALSPRLGTIAPHGRLTLGDCEQALGVVFSVLARHGASSDLEAKRAYEAGMSQLLPRHRPAYSMIDDWATAFDESLDRLCQLQISAKQLLIEALVRTIAHDEVLAPEEAELLRAICGVLECPLPPVLPMTG